MYRHARAVGSAFSDLTACVVPGEYRMLPISEEARSVGKPIAFLRPERAHGVINQSLKRAVVAIASTPQMRTLATPSCACMRSAEWGNHGRGFQNRSTPIP